MVQFHRPHNYKQKIGDNKIKKYKVTINSEKDVQKLNDKIAIDSFFVSGETITNNPLHLGVNIVSDERIIKSAKEYSNNHEVYCIELADKEELLQAYERTMTFYNTHNIKRKFSKFAELFWLLFEDGTNSYMWAIDNVCTLFPECDKEELTNELDRYI